MPTRFFEKGNTIGKAGKPRGTKNKLAHTVLADLLDVWDEPVTPGSDITRGVAALRVMSRTHPDKFAQLYAGLLPRELHYHGAMEELSDDQIDEVILRIREQLAQNRLDQSRPLLIEERVPHER